MNKPPYNYRPINPESIIDLRPKQSKLTLTWQDLTAVRIVFFIGRLGGRLLVVIFDSIFRLAKNLSLILVDIVFGFKNMILNLRYVGAEQGIIFKKIFKFLLDLILLLPRAIIKFFSRIFGLFKTTTTRVEDGLKRESKLLSMPKFKERPTLVWRSMNFALLLCLLLSPFFLIKIWQKLEPTRTAIISTTTSAIAGMFSAKNLIQEKNFTGAQNAFEQAGIGFKEAQNNLKEVSGGLLYLAQLVPDKRFKLASESDHLLKAGSLSASIGVELTEAIKPSDKTSLTDFLDRFIKHAIPASDEAQVLANELNKINIENLPVDYQPQFIKLRNQANTLAPSLKQAVEIAQKANDFFGKQVDKRYLLVFQNNSEKRASGGFIGSFATVDFSKGEMKNLKVPKGGSYDTEAGLLDKIIAPEPLWLLNPLWHFWDANWWPDWPTTAKKLEWFYEKSDGPTVDGVIALTPTVIEDLLRIHGAVDMTNDYGVTITADNFWPVTQAFSEQKPSVTKEPKKIIGDLMARLLEDLPKNLTFEKIIASVGVFEKNLNEKQILLYFNDDSLEDSVKQFGWDASIKQTKDDYLMVVSTNLGGQKSDRAIKETINHETEILPDGQIIVNLSIVREHTAPKNQAFIGFRNVNWLRVYVPEGSELISSSGWRFPDRYYFKEPAANWLLDKSLDNERVAQTDPINSTKIYKENNKTVFANWSMVDPGETAIIKLKYRLPLTFKKIEEPRGIVEKIRNYFFPVVGRNYSLLVQKQPGSIGTMFNSKLVIDQGWENYWSYPKELQVDKNGWTISKTLDTDLYSVVLFK